MSELKACPLCGSEPETGWFAVEFVINCPTCRFVFSEHAIEHDDEPERAKEAAIEKWNTRALDPALDVVIAEVEAYDTTFWRKQLAGRYRIEASYKAADGSLVERHYILSLLRALREQSAKDSPSTPAAQSDTGDKND